MALDGAFLRHIKAEIEEKIIGGRVDKIYQPNRDEIVIAIRMREGNYKLLLSARANSPRINFTVHALENPKQPPMLCMLLRKKLQSAKLVSVRQPELERVLHLEFDSVNELGDHVMLTLTIEIMGKYSNIILSDEEGKIVDALKRVNAEMTSQRLVLPKLSYQLPPAQNKLNPLQTTSQELVIALKEIPADMALSKALLSTLQGISPVVCREIEHQAGRGKDLFIKQMDDENWFRAGFFYNKLKEAIEKTAGTPFMVTDKRKKPLDFSFIDILQYGTAAVVHEEETFSELLDNFYNERDTIERMRVREQDLLKTLSNISDRLQRKIANQQAELEQGKNKENLRVFGDIINANLYSIPDRAESVKLQNFYSENLEEVTIKLDSMLTPSQNAQKYYKEYRKAKTAEEKLTDQIAIAKDEYIYIDSVFETLTRAKTEQDLAEIKAELAEVGYIRIIRSKKAKIPALRAPLEFTTSDGFTVFVGRNNRQNDKLTMKTANNNDVWFHTKDIPGSHTVLVTSSKEVTDLAISEAAKIAALHSRAKDSTQVAVDYTQIRNVSKPQGAKPGMVIYVKYKTIFVNLNQED